MPSYHARLGPSGAYKWSVCTAAPSMEDGLTDTSGDAAVQGTAEHFLGAQCLELGLDPYNYEGFAVALFADGSEEWANETNVGKAEHVITFDREAVERVDAYVGFVNQLVERVDGFMLVEKRVPIDHITGEGHWTLNGVEVDHYCDGAVWHPAGGTSDVIVLTQHEIIVIDYKSGQNRVEAFYEISPATFDAITGEPVPPVVSPNKQLAMYASGALRDYGWFAPFQTARMVIVQPRLHLISEYAVTVEELGAFTTQLALKAHETRTNPQFFPSEDTCRHCKARSACKARSDYVLTTTIEGFSEVGEVALQDAKPRFIDDSKLGVVYAALPVISKFVDDINTRVFTLLAAGQTVLDPHGQPMKLVQGRAGNRKWNDDSVDTIMLEAGVPEDVVYERKVISPASAEKLAKAVTKGKNKRDAIIDVETWDTLQSKIGQADPSLSIVPASDPRPAYSPSTDGFSDCFSQPSQE